MNLARIGVEPRRQYPKVADALIRVSMERERDTTTSPENQSYAIENFAKAHGIQIAEWVVGIDESGSKKKSAWWAKLDRSIERLERGEIDGILVWKFSRTARHRLKWAVALDRVDTAGGLLISVTEPTDATPAGKLQRGMLGEFNAYQADLIGEVWRETHARRVRHGLPATGGPRFGYVIDPETREYRPDPETAPVLADLYRRYLAGQGSAQIARRLHDLGIPTRRGGSWTQTGIMAVLDSGFAAGLLSRTRPSPDKSAPPPWEREYRPGAHEAIIDQATWEAYVAARRKRHREKAPAARSYMLTGLIRCGECGGPMRGKSERGRLLYVCTRAYLRPGMRKVAITCSIVDAAVEEWVLGLADEIKERADALAKTDRRESDRTFQRRSLDRQVQRARERVAKLTLRLADDTISPEAYKVAVEEIEAQQREAEQQLARLAGNPVERQALESLSTDLRVAWPRMTTGERSLELRPLLGAVLVKSARRRGDPSDRIVIVPRWELRS